jgi:choline dehydrogenase
VKQRLTKPISVLPYTKTLRSAMVLLQYLLTKEGPGSSPGFESMAFLKSRPELVAPDLQYYILHLMYEDHGRKIINEHGFMLYFNLQRPQSRGTVMIRSKNPLHHPAIQPNYLQEADDVRTLRDGVKIARDIIAQKAFDPYRGSEYGPGERAKTDAEIDAYVRRTAESICHPVGTCKMGQDSLAVVDDRLRVHGLSGLRVVDASVMPRVVSGNTNAPTIMIAERASDFIRNG